MDSVVDSTNLALAKYNMADKEICGKTTSVYGQAWGLASSRGHRRTWENGKRKMVSMSSKMPKRSPMQYHCNNIPTRDNRPPAKMDNLKSVPWFVDLEKFY